LDITSCRRQNGNYSSINSPRQGHTAIFHLWRYHCYDVFNRNKLGLSQFEGRRRSDRSGSRVPASTMPGGKPTRSAGQAQISGGITMNFHFAWKRMQGKFHRDHRAEFIGKGTNPHRKLAGWRAPGLDSASPHVERGGSMATGWFRLQFRRRQGGQTEEARATLNPCGRHSTGAAAAIPTLCRLRNMASRSALFRSRISIWASRFMWAVRLLPRGRAYRTGHIPMMCVSLCGKSRVRAWKGSIWKPPGAIGSCQRPPADHP